MKWLSTTKIIVGPEILKQKRDARAKQQQQMQQQQAMSHGVQTAKVGADAANVLANTKVGAGADALSQILSGGQ